MAQLEHVNVTVTDPEATAAWLGRVFGWHVRWKGAAKNGGFTVHCGNETGYVALYRPKTGEGQDAKPDSYHTQGGLNHWAVTVDDLDDVEARVKAEGFATHSHADYEPGRRFYFHDGDGIEIEVVHYD